MDTFYSSEAGMIPIENNWDQQKGEFKAILLTSHDVALYYTSSQMDEMLMEVKMKIGKSNEELLYDIISELQSSVYR